MATSGIKPKEKGVFLRNCIDFVFGFENKRGEILDSWILFADSFTFPPQEFYASLEKEMASRKIPSMEIIKEEFSEGGLLSDKRTYLRLFRERLALYTCAAPFGTGYFFSFRAVYVPALVRLWHILALLFFLNVIGGLLLMFLGFTFAIVALAALPFAVAAVFRNATAAGVRDLDTMLLKIPVVSTIYENWFREDTYYRIDTRSMYLQTLPEIVRKLAEEITAAKGAKLLPQNEHPPMIGELHNGLAAIQTRQ
ncbi:MAG TPA: hypothetical protein VN578_25820 [Candidatus Binatia bacterium]|jgi:hypothetical protein|nr:hypothetical protein [Candidatus Binatia bacterium]